MEKITINVPKGISKLSEWADFKNQFNPNHKKFILNKQITGCGATTYYLMNDEPLILCSHRSRLLKTKADNKLHHDRVHLFKNAEDTGQEALQRNRQRLREYIDKCYKLNQPPKILVTVDSLQHVFEILRDCGILQKFTLVSDECQCLLTDAPFKGEVLIDYTMTLNEVNRVIYLSATPLENYLAMIPSNYSDIGQLPNYELVWEDVAKPHVWSFEVKSLSKAIDRIIQDYKRNGYFVRNNYHQATQAVFFFNEVNSIVNAIKRNGLTPDECNVICAENANNATRLKSVGMKIGATPQEGEPHKTYTFVTKAAFEGDDFCHTNAMTYVFGDPNNDRLLIDITNDIAQILGRQRLDVNPWKNWAYIYTLAPKEGALLTQEDFVEQMNKKQKLTQEKIEQYNQVSNDYKHNMREENLTIKNGKHGYKSDYLTFAQLPSGECVAVENFLVRISEQRAWDLRTGNYLENLRVLYNDSYRQQNPIVSQLEDLMTQPGCFQYKMMTYIQCRQAYPNLERDIQSSVMIEKKYHDYYNHLGPDVIRANSYQESLLRNLLGIAASQSDVEIKIHEHFKVGERYTSKEAKEIIQSIYDELGLNKTAKATDLNEYFIVERACQWIKGKSVNGIRIKCKL